MNTSAQPAVQPKLPANIPEYLEHLRRSLAGADPALIQDALYDAEEYLRSEMAEHPSLSEAEVIAQVASSYGAPEEVADIYRDTEVKVQTALRPPVAKPRRSVLGRFFGVIAEPRTYAALFYMLLSMATGIFYFTWVVTGVSLSAGLAVLIIGVPFAILYFGSVRVLSLVEGRIVETMLGERMPRRPLYAERGKPLLKRIGEMFTDPRTWTTQLYFLLLMPLGIVYFTIAVTLLSVSIAFAGVRAGLPAAVRHPAHRPRHRLPARPVRQAPAGEVRGGLNQAPLRGPRKSRRTRRLFRIRHRPGSQPRPIARCCVSCCCGAATFGALAASCALTAIGCCCASTRSTVAIFAAGSSGARPCTANSERSFAATLSTLVRPCWRAPATRLATLRLSRSPTWPRLRSSAA
jgi:uncharacterized membrane protein